MMMLSQAAHALNARLIGADARFEEISTDTRTLAPGSLYIALRGPNFDGHNFITQALDRGAAAVMVDQTNVDLHPPTCSAIVVEDTRLALGGLAAYWRTQFEIPLIGVTGSNGKTTVKEMCAAILRAWQNNPGDQIDHVLATEGNLNNDIGMPKMLLRLRPEHRAAVIEMGMNHPGEIAYLAQICRPTVAVVTNAGRAHLEGMGNLDAIAIEKGHIYDGLPLTGYAIINADDPHANYWFKQNNERHCRTFGVVASADISAQFQLHPFHSDIEMYTPAGKIELRLSVPGKHNVCNALAASAACLAAGANLAAIQKGLESFSSAKGRLQRYIAQGQAQLIDDTYNANPDSVRAAIDVLCNAPGRHILVLGDMGEIGLDSTACHREIGAYAQQAGVDSLLCLGKQSAYSAEAFGPQAQAYSDVEALLAALRPQLASDVTVLVKGSRFMQMERVSQAIRVSE